MHTERMWHRLPNFNPIIMATPNETAIIYTIVLRFNVAAFVMAHSLIPICFDMDLLTKAISIVWAYED